MMAKRYNCKAAAAWHENETKKKKNSNEGERAIAVQMQRSQCNQCGRFTNESAFGVQGQEGQDVGGGKTKKLNKKKQIHYSRQSRTHDEGVVIVVSTRRDGRRNEKQMKQEKNVFMVECVVKVDHATKKRECFKIKKK